MAADATASLTFFDALIIWPIPTLVVIYSQNKMLQTRDKALGTN